MRSLHGLAVELEQLARVNWPCPDGIAVPREDLKGTTQFWMQREMRRLIQERRSKLQDLQKKAQAVLHEVERELVVLDTIAEETCPQI